MSKVSAIYKQLSNILSSNPSLANQLSLELSRIVSTAYNQAMLNDEESFCFKFSLPITAVNKLYTLLQLNQKAVSEAFEHDWKYPSKSVMYGDPYYHILLLLIYYGIKEGQGKEGSEKNKYDIIARHALTILLMKIWNGRKAKYLKYCDKRIMKYVVDNMVSNKHLVSKYSTPMSLIVSYFVPSLLAKYGPQIAVDVNKLKLLFMQAWGRVNQLFVSNMRQNMETGEKEAQGGLLPLYMKAKQNNLYLTTKTISDTGEDEEEGPSFDQYATIHNRDEIATKTTDYITMSKPVYSPDVIADINSKTKVSVKVIQQILDALHDHRNYDIIHSIYVIILSRTQVVDKDDICRPEFLVSVKKNVISSKNNQDIINLQKLIDRLLTQIFKEKLKLNFNSYSVVQQIQIRNVVLYGLIYNLRKCNCHGVSM